MNRRHFFGLSIGAGLAALFAPMLSRLGKKPETRVRKLPRRDTFHDGEYHALGRFPHSEDVEYLSGVHYIPDPPEFVARNNRFVQWPGTV